MHPLDSLSVALDTCTFCPKLCRFACPVAEAERRETVTPWGLMSRANFVRKGQVPLDVETAAIFEHCTGCGRCTQNCRHGRVHPRWPDLEGTPGLGPARPGTSARALLPP